MMFQAPQQLIRERPQALLGPVRYVKCYQILLDLQTHICGDYGSKGYKGYLSFMFPALRNRPICRIFESAS